MKISRTYGRSASDGSGPSSAAAAPLPVLPPPPPRALPAVRPGATGLSGRTTVVQSPPSAQARGAGWGSSGVGGRPPPRATSKASPTKAGGTTQAPPAYVRNTMELQESGELDVSYDDLEFAVVG